MVKRVLTLIFCLVLLCNYSIAQDWSIFFTPRSRQLRDIHVNNPENIIVVGGNPVNDSRTYMSTTENAGSEWLFNDIYPGKLLNSLLFFNNQFGICAGDSESYYETTDGGLTWDPKDFGLDLLGSDVSCLHRGYYGTIFAAGGGEDQNGFLIKSNNNGDTWFNVDFWPENEIINIFSVTNTKFIVCGNNDFIEISDNSGETWTVPNIEDIPVEVGYSSLDFYDEEFGLCVGGVKGVDSVACIMKTNDGGSNWNVVYNQTNPCLNSVEIIDDQVAYAVGDYGKILKTENAGENWSFVIVEDNPEVDLYSVHFVNSHLGAISGQWGHVFIYNDGQSATPEIETLSATDVNDTSANLNASINPGFVQTELYFMYGTDLNLSNEVLVGSFWGGELRLEGYRLNGLSNNQEYYYRARIVNTYGEYLGEVKSFYTGNPIPNWDFENWTQYNIDALESWYSSGNVSRTILEEDTIVSLYPVNDETFSHDDISVILNARFEVEFIDGDFIISNSDGGYATHERPSQMNVIMNYEIEYGDSALVFIGLKNVNGFVAKNIHYITGSSDGTFVDSLFTIDYLNSEIPDTLLIGFCNSIPDKSEPETSYVFNSMIEISQITFDIPDLQIDNHSFSNWENLVIEKPDQWYFNDSDWFYGGNIEYFPFYKVEDSFHNDYAICINSIITSSDTIRGFISAKDDESKFKINHKHETLEFYAKYFPEANDTATVSINLYENGTQVGNANIDITETVNVWQKYILDINYETPEAYPDSANIFISSCKRDNISEALLFIDKICFDGDYIPVENEIFVECNLYPNPAEDVIYVNNILEKNSTISVEIFDISGKLKYVDNIIADNRNLMINISFLRRGYYILIMDNGKNKIVKRFVKI